MTCQINLVLTEKLNMEVKKNMPTSGTSTTSCLLSWDSVQKITMYSSQRCLVIHVESYSRFSSSRFFCTQFCLVFNIFVEFYRLQSQGITYKKSGGFTRQKFGIVLGNHSVFLLNTDTVALTAVLQQKH